MRLEWMASSQALLAMTAVCTFWRQISHEKNKNGVSDRGVLARPVVECHAKGACHMAKMIFINLPVSNLARATAFYQAVGAEKNEQFSDGTASCMVFSETIHAMLLTHDKFRQFTPKKIADAKTSSEVLICISADSRGAVDDVVSKAQAAGGGADPSPKQDFGFMYGRSFEDPDGHIWEVMWMDVSAATAAQSATADA
jgi:predicted lactoylglutathione lyase